jgi:hypothetical protein
MTETVFLKLGGSMITDKTRVEQVLPDVLARAASEVASALRDAPGLRLVLGHGSGSFGHVAARRYGTRNGVQGPEAWMGFARVAEAAARLNRLVVAGFLAAGVPAWSVQPSAGGWCADGQISQWQGEPVEMALARGLVPLIYGDVMLDEAQGGTIASTEELFAWLVAEAGARDPGGHGGRCVQRGSVGRCVGRAVAADYTCQPAQPSGQPGRVPWGGCHRGHAQQGDGDVCPGGGVSTARGAPGFRPASRCALRLTTGLAQGRGHRDQCTLTIC